MTNSLQIAREALEKIRVTLGESLDGDFPLWSQSGFAAPRHAAYTAWKCAGQATAALAQIAALSAPEPAHHASDCALHNAPYGEPGPCDCAPSPGESWTEEQIEAAAKRFNAERRRMGVNVPSWEEWGVSDRACTVEAFKIALSTLSRSEAGAPSRADLVAIIRTVKPVIGHGTVGLTNASIDAAADAIRALYPSPPAPGFQCEDCSAIYGVGGYCKRCGANLRPRSDPPAPAGLDSREGLARIIEPGDWAYFDFYMRNTVAKADREIARDRVIAMFSGCRHSLAKADQILALLSQPPAADEHEDHPCGLCDTSGRCTFACENAESVPAPTPEQLSTRYWSMLVLSAKVLDDLADPEAEPKKITRIRESCARLRDEIREVIASPAHPEAAEMPGRSDHD